MKSYKKVPNINASDFATILGVNPYQSVYELLEKKIEKKHPFFGNKFTKHKFANLEYITLAVTS